jgi:hypothetical protein
MHECMYVYVCKWICLSVCVCMYASEFVIFLVCPPLHRRRSACWRRSSRSAVADSANTCTVRLLICMT